MDLSNLKPPKGAKHAKKRVGRGQGSGNGKTAGRGHKGAKSRSGFKFKRGFEGGQMPLHRRLPKRGFNNPSAKEHAVVNLGRIQAAIDAGRLDAGAPVTAEALIAAGLVRRVRDGIRLLGQGELTAGIRIEVHGASESARAAVEKAGGSVMIVGAGEAAS